MRLFLVDRDNWQEVAQTLGRNRRRSIATAFGIFWGVFMLIVLLSLNTGVSNGIKEVLEQMSAKTAVIYTNNTSEPYEGFKAGRHWSLKQGDMEILRSRMPSIKFIATALPYFPRNQKNTYCGTEQARALALGVSKDYFKIYKQRVICGRAFNDLDHKEQRKYCLISKNLAKELAPHRAEKTLLGKNLKIENLNLTIIGVLDETEGINLGYQMDNTVFIPYKLLAVAKQQGDRIHSLMVSLHETVDEAVEIKAIGKLIRTLHKIAPSDEKALDMFILSEIISVFENIDLGLSILFWLVGLGTLFTGMVSISNILLVTVKERTQEIGVRRALGAKPKDIIYQLLLEASTLSFFSGLIGLVLAVGIMAVVNKMLMNGADMDFPFKQAVISFPTAIAILVIIIVSGILSGLLPAYKALEVKAIEAIQEE